MKYGPYPKYNVHSSHNVFPHLSSLAFSLKTIHKDGIYGRKFI